ncbi:hypothetical protein GGI07_004917 [Coemansia sp. Benny D115]|nr:hypothetical protein GGI07_004917 [Coemansia sp. Benny D115]
MAWCSALVWAEKAVLLSETTSDLLWLVDALVTNGQYRQAEEWLLNPRYSLKFRTNPQGRYLASVVAMRLGRTEDALELLSMDIGGSESGLPGINTPSAVATHIQVNDDPLLTPTAFRTTATMDNVAPPISPFAHASGVSHEDHHSNIADDAVDNSAAGGRADIPPLNPKALMLYMQGAAVVQLGNIGGNESTPSIKHLNAQVSLLPPTIQQGTATVRQKPIIAAHLAGMGSLVARLWIQAIYTDPRCWEAWTGIREHGLLTHQEEHQLITSLDWTACCGGSEEAARFFQNYCLATQTTYSLSQSVVDATTILLHTYPQLIQDPTLRTIQAARLLSLGRARECLEYTVKVMEYRRVPDPQATAIHITALTLLYSKKALFRIAHELAEEFGISSIKRAEIEPADTGSSLGLKLSRNLSSSLSAFEGLGSGSTHASVFGSGSLTSTPRGVSMGASVAGTGRVRTGARALLVPETPSRAAIGHNNAGGIGASSAGRPSTLGAASGFVARSVVQSTPAIATAAWRGLWSLPTWTHPGPPVLATYPSALGPAQASAVNAEAQMSTLGTLTATGAQSVGSPTQYEFVGASLAWYAIGCYYLVSAALLVYPEYCQREWPLTGMSVSTLGRGPAGQGGPTSGLLRRTLPLTPEAERLLSESRRWLAKTTLASPRSVVAWVAFAHSFVVSGEWEAATRALHTAVGLCGCDDIIHGGGRDSNSSSSHSSQTPARPWPQEAAGLAGSSGKTPGKATTDSGRGQMERGSRLAHSPLASLGSVYMQMGDLGMAESCFDASARCLTGYRISEWISVWRPVLEPMPNAQLISWVNSRDKIKSTMVDPIQQASTVDPQLLNDIGVMYYNSNDMRNARIFFVLALATLTISSGIQDDLHTAFNSLGTKSGRSRNVRSAYPEEQQAYNALFEANLGNTLRRIGDHNVALLCLRDAVAQAPSNSEMLLSVAFTLHMLAIESYSDSPVAFSADLDEAIDIYHKILADHPGDPVTTDLLSLALELSVNMQSAPLLNDKQADDDQFGDLDGFEIREPEELGIFDLGRSSLLDAIPRIGRYISPEYNSSRNENEQEHDLATSETRIHSSGHDHRAFSSAEDEDSDQVMDIEEDSGSDSDMAMD